MEKRSKYVMTVQEAAKTVNVSERTVYNWIYQGKIEAYGLPGGGWRIPLRAVAELVGLTEQELGSGVSASAEYAKVLNNIENLARGGDFEDEASLAEWNLRVEDGSRAKMRIDRTTAAIGKSSLLFEIVEMSGRDAGRPRIGQTQMIEKGKTYTLSSFYKAEKHRTVNIVVQLNAHPWTQFAEKVISIGTEWVEQWITFAAPQDAEVTIQPARNTGSDIKYWLDGIRFFEGEYQPS